MSKAVAIIINGISRKKKKFYRDILPPLSAKFNVTVFETQYAGHAADLADKAVEEGYSIIIAAGGDGTLNQVLNGTLRNGASVLPTLGLIPLGTGNDFARTCGLGSDPQKLISLLEFKITKPVDIGRLASHDENGKEVTRYFINACSLGMGPAAVKLLEKSSRVLGPTLTYWKAIVTTFFTHKPQEIYCKTADREWHGKVMVLAVANGKSFGNAIYIAPDALPDDGWLNLFVASDMSLFKFLFFQEKLKRKKKIGNNLFRYEQLTSIRLSSPQICALETEGELAGNLPAELSILPGKINFLK